MGFGSVFVRKFDRVCRCGRIFPNSGALRVVIHFSQLKLMDEWANALCSSGVPGRELIEAAEPNIVCEE